jgi:predicted Zn-dependent protease
MRRFSFAPPPLHIVLLSAALRAAVPAAYGHGDVHETIAVLTKEIEAKPGKASLHFERASLYAQFDHFAEALDDLAKVNALEPQNDLPMALRGSILRRSGKPAEARVQQEAFLKKYPQHAQVRFDYCQTLADLKETAAALRELDALIAAVEHPSPDAVAMRLRLTEATDAAAALTWLGGFLTKHPLPVFQEEALKLEMKLGRTAAAVQRMEAMITKAPRPESLLLRKAELLAATGDKAGARAAARAAQEAIARLPAHIRSTKACAGMEAKAAQFLSPPP